MSPPPGGRATTRGRAVRELDPPEDPAQAGRFRLQISQRLAVGRERERPGDDAPRRRAAARRPRPRPAGAAWAGWNASASEGFAMRPPRAAMSAGVQRSDMGTSSRWDLSCGSYFRTLRIHSSWIPAVQALGHGSPGIHPPPSPSPTSG